MRISWTQKAIVNLDSAVEYIATDSPAAASRVAQKILNRMVWLSSCGSCTPR